MSDIVWLEDPSTYEYVREGHALTTKRRGPPRLAIRGALLIGYEELPKAGKGIQPYDRRFWWLKPYDRPFEAYPAGFPAEAVTFQPDGERHEVRR